MRSHSVKFDQLVDATGLDRAAVIEAALEVYAAQLPVNAVTPGGQDRAVP